MRILDAQYDNGICWKGAVAQERRAARKLVRAANEQVEECIGTVGRYVVGKAARALNGLMGSEYRDEMNALADALEVDAADLLVANLAYDLSNSVGCSTFVHTARSKPLHARNLDWVFPRQLLRKHTIAVRVHDAPSGDYSLVTWPGFCLSSSSNGCKLTVRDGATVARGQLAAPVIAYLASARAVSSPRSAERSEGRLYTDCAEAYRSRDVARCISRS